MDAHVFHQYFASGDRYLVLVETYIFPVIFSQWKAMNNLLNMSHNTYVIKSEPHQNTKLAICQVRAKEKHVVQWRTITLSWWVKNHSILIRFLQMVYAENCKKQNSSSFFNGGASSPCSASRTRFIKVTACLYLTVFFLRLASKIMALFSACCPLSGSLHLGYRNGNGATHWPILSKQNT